MNNRPTFQQTVDVLVKAYLNDNLNRMACRHCAVGNIIEASGGFNHKAPGAHWPGIVSPHWASKFSPVAGKFEVDSTGYTPKELKWIEIAFMNGSRPEEDGEDDNFNGLMAVVDVLADIHGVDLSVKEEAKKLFVKKKPCATRAKQK